MIEKVVFDEGYLELILKELVIFIGNINIQFLFEIKDLDFSEYNKFKVKVFRFVFVSQKWKIIFIIELL